MTVEDLEVIFRTPRGPVHAVRGVSFQLALQQSWASLAPRSRRLWLQRHLRPAFGRRSCSVLRLDSSESRIVTREA